MTGDETTQSKLRQGGALLQQGKIVEAEKIYTQILRQEPNRVDALHFLGMIFCRTARVEQGAELIRRAIAVNPAIAVFHSSLGNALMALGRTKEALASYDTSIVLKPDYATAYNNRGNALKDLERFQDALENYDRAIALKPDYITAYYNRGTALKKLRRPADALSSFDKAIALKPDYAEAYGSRGIALMDLKRPHEALASYDRAIALKPDLAEAHGNRGTALNILERYGEALASFDRAIALGPDIADVYCNRGSALAELKNFEPALASFDKAMILDPDNDHVEGLRLYTKMQLCDWCDFHAERARLISRVKSGRAKMLPFAFLTMSSSSGDQLLCAERYAAENHPLIEPPLWRGERYGHRKVRVAYLSADFRDHAVAYLIAGLIEEHDRSRFEMIGVSFGNDDGGETRKRFISAFDAFHDVRGKSDKEVATLLRANEVDIAVDLLGYTRSSRLGIFAHRPAPIQVNYLGYPGTLGSRSIDYLIADSIVIPPEQRQFYTEKIVSLPDSYQVNDSKRKIAEHTPTRRALGLPETGFVFCCFNTHSKITPDVFGIWMRILRRVEGSVLWLLEDDLVAAENLKREAEARGVDSKRLVFAGRAPLAEHLARHRAADLFIDTLPYNAHTTASDALWAGLPVLTCLGDTFPGRVAASLLSAIHLPELITPTLEEYERAAIELATDPERLARIKRDLAGNRLTAPLFDTARVTRHIEEAYTAMRDKHDAGLPPDHIAIPR